jgi:hypothetical protein
MRKVTIVIAAIGLALPGVISVPAQALSDRTWVSGLGSDSGACTRAAPCATFQFALGQTNPSGVVNCVDAGSYGTLSINKAITILCEAGTGGILVASGGNGISIGAPATDVVTLRGLDLDGLGGGFIGITIIGAREVHIEKMYHPQLPLRHQFDGPPHRLSFNLDHLPVRH